MALFFTKQWRCRYVHRRGYAHAHVQMHTVPTLPHIRLSAATPLPPLPHHLGRCVCVCMCAGVQASLDAGATDLPFHKIIQVRPLSLCLEISGIPVRRAPVFLRGT